MMRCSQLKRSGWNSTTRQVFNRLAMAKYVIPPEIKRVRVVMGLGGHYKVWNGKTGREEFFITCRNRKQANEIARLINQRQHQGEIVVD